MAGAYFLYQVLFMMRDGVKNLESDHELSPRAISKDCPQA